MKTCKICKKNLHVNMFYLRCKSGTQRKNACKDCYNKKYVTRSEFETTTNQKRKDKYLKTLSARLKNIHGITIEDYFKMSEKQGDTCAICLGIVDSGGRLHVDHNHISGIIRGLLCINCNLGLGNMKDNLNSLRKSILYLNKKTFYVGKQKYLEDKPTCARGSKVRRLYGITVEDEKDIILLQKNKCKICNEKLGVGDKRAIDHTYNENGEVKVRGVLCRSCNIALGHFKDDPKNITNAIKYLKKSR